MPGANPLSSYPAGTGLASPYQLALLAKQAGFPAAQIPTAVAVAMAESSGQINSTNHNTNGTTDHGLWQINDVNLGAGGVANAYAGSISDPLANAKAAYAVWRSQGWTGWSTYNNDSYHKFFTEAVSARNAATASTADQIAGALLPLVGLGAAAALPAEAATDAGAAEAGAAGAATGAAASTAGYATKGLSDLANLAKAGGIAALLVDPHFLLRMLELVGGVLLLYFGLRQLGNVAGATV